MVTQNYARSFEHSVLSYTYQPKKKTIQYQEHRLADQLVNHLVEDLVKDVITNPLDELRIKALRKLGQWGSEWMEVRVLTRICETDPNLEIREEASKAIAMIRSRMDIRTEKRR